MVTYNQLISLLPNPNTESSSTNANHKRMKRIEPRKRGRPRKKQVVPSSPLKSTCKKLREGAGAVVHTEKKAKTFSSSRKMSEEVEDMNEVTEDHYLDVDVEDANNACGDGVLAKSVPGPGKPRSMPADDDLDRLEEICDALRLRQSSRNENVVTTSSTLQLQEKGEDMAVHNQDQSSRKRINSLGLDLSSVAFVNTTGPFLASQSVRVEEESSDDSCSSKDKDVCTLPSSSPLVTNTFETYDATCQSFAELACSTNFMYVYPKSSQSSMTSDSNSTSHSSGNSTHSSSSPIKSGSNCSSQSYAQSVLSALLKNSNCSSMTQRLLHPGPLDQSNKVKADGEAIRIVANLSTVGKDKTTARIQNICTQKAINDKAKDTSLAKLLIGENTESHTEKKGSNIIRENEKTWKEACVVYPAISFEEALGTFSTKARVVVKSEPPFQIVHCNAAYIAVITDWTMTSTDLTPDPSRFVIGLPFIGGGLATSVVKAQSSINESGYIYKNIRVIKAYGIAPTSTTCNDPKSFTSSSSKSSNERVNNQGVENFDYFLLEVEESYDDVELHGMQDQQVADIVRDVSIVQEQSQNIEQSLPPYEEIDHCYEETEEGEETINNSDENLWLEDPTGSCYSTLFS